MYVIGAAALRIQYNSGGLTAICGDPSSISHDPLSRLGGHRTSDSEEDLKNIYLNSCFPFTFWPSMTVGSFSQSTVEKNRYIAWGAHQDMD